MYPDEREASKEGEEGSKEEKVRVLGSERVREPSLWHTHKSMQVARLTGCLALLRETTPAHAHRNNTSASSRLHPNTQKPNLVSKW